MLPVQTVMIRYMVLVYRWGRGWLGTAGAWEGFAGGCARRWVASAGAVATGRARKSPADEGPAGPLSDESYSVGFSSSVSEFSRGFAGLLTRV